MKSQALTFWIAAAALALAAGCAGPTSPSFVPNSNTSALSVTHDGAGSSLRADGRDHRSPEASPAPSPSGFPGPGVGNDPLFPAGPIGRPGLPSHGFQ